MAEATTPTAGVPIVLAFNHKRIADMVTTALESPVGDWMIRAKTVCPYKPAGVDAKSPWYSQAAFWVDQLASLDCRVSNPVIDDRGDTYVKSLRMEDFQLALILMATKDDGAYSHHFADFLRSNEDANTADLFMQFAVYGEEVFA